MKKIIIGNQKNYMTIKDVKIFLEAMKNNVNENIIICPSNIYIPYYLKRNFKVGLQNIVGSDTTCTGEITINQIKDLNINYVIVGHSERRINFNENDEDINEKVQELVNSDIVPILCVGETLEEKNNFETNIVLKKQLVNSLKEVKNNKKIIIAYEPVWAIGTGLIPEVEEIKEISKYIQNILTNYLNLSETRILYGGSVNSKNINELKQIDDLDGFLIGKSSTNSEEFLKIINSIKMNDK